MVELQIPSLVSLTLIQCCGNFSDIVQKIMVYMRQINEISLRRLSDCFFRSIEFILPRIRTAY